ncbi:hypothetical protein SCE1572_18020 [Sorangium cellulosum So0157-2]|uniref:Uncharacterized protein n=1 Tax=Sorangium cellulosum So0157-2 TaxID=1254432 RepID=S4XWD7_SORCE|nr:hypothetical protein SCE1572_18020 [Sorangium cellulosum So0157-2]
MPTTTAPASAITAATAANPTARRRARSRPGAPSALRMA